MFLVDFVLGLFQKRCCAGMDSTVSIPYFGSCMALENTHHLSVLSSRFAPYQAQSLEKKFLSRNFFPIRRMDFFFLGELLWYLGHEQMTIALASLVIIMIYNLGHICWEKFFRHV